MGKLVAIIPCFNCEKQIVRVIESISKHILDICDEVVLIENRSDRDKTLETAFECIEKQNHREKFTLIQNNKNIGLGGSHKVGITYAREHGYEYISFIHGDHQTDPKELRRLFEFLKKEGSISACLGARFMWGAKLFGYNKLRLVANYLLTTLYSLVSLKPTFELGAGLSVHRVSDFNDKKYLHYTNDFNFYCFMLLDYYTKGLKVKFIPISYYETDQISNVGNFHVGLITLKCVLYWRFFGLEKFNYSDKGFKRII